MRKRVPTTTVRIEVALRRKVKIVSEALGVSAQQFVGQAVRERIRDYEDAETKRVGASRERTVEFV
jgi:hypothetical protein